MKANESFNKDNLSSNNHSQNKNSNIFSHSQGNISFGEDGVDQTYVPPMSQDKNKNKKINKAKIPHKDKINSGNVYIFNKHLNININNSINNINNNSNNSSGNNSHNSNDNNEDNMAQIPNSNNSNNNNQKNLGNNISDSQKANEVNPFFAPKNNNIPIKNVQNNIIPNNQKQSINYINKNNNNNKNNNIIQYQHRKENKQKAIINQVNNLNISLKKDEIDFPLPNPNALNLEENIIFSRYEKPALTGLRNLGKTSYLNSILQLLYNIRPLVNFLFKFRNYLEKHQEFYPFSYEIYRLCTQIYPENNKKETYHSSEVLTTFANHNLVYNDYYEKNPNECISFLLSKLNDELSSNDNNNKNLIYNYFTWIKMEEMKCQKCSEVFKDFHNFQTFDLNYSGVVKYDKSKKIKIKNCIDFYNTPKLKKNFCSKCNKYERMVSKNFIYYYPKIFIFLLDLKGNNYNDFVIEHKINLGEKTDPKIYVLNGIVFYDAYKERYNALCASPVDKMWYLYDDENVQPVNLEKFIRLYNKDPKLYLPCILVYIR